MKGRRRVLVGGVALALAGLTAFPSWSLAGDQSRAKDIVQQTCTQCHRLEGKADSRFNLRAPDLIWAGSKYQRSWLIRWLTGKEA
ncbi:MAG: c-type cytochrome, partial [Nitrospira sp.]|nr:c-type cytochrome [Nitrospira sp.]